MDTHRLPLEYATSRIESFDKAMERHLLFFQAFYSDSDKITERCASSIWSLLNSEQLRKDAEKEVNGLFRNPAPRQLREKKISKYFAEKITAIVNSMRECGYNGDRTDIMCGKAIMEGHLSTTYMYVPEECRDAFMELRIAVSKADVEDIKPQGMPQLFAALIAYHLDWYICFANAVLEKENIPIFSSDADHVYSIEKRFICLLSQLLPKEDAYSLISTKTREKMNRAEKKELIADWCDKENVKDICDYLDLIEEEFHIGSRACSKKKFAQIAYILMRDLNAWSIRSMNKAQYVLALYYSIDPTSYKINDIEADALDLVSEDKSKLLSNGIINLNARCGYKDEKRW